jgi:hypothetical protein
MGFFDSFSKKKESPPSFMSGLPPPPMPEKKIKFDAPLPTPNSLPLPPTQQQKAEEKSVFSVPFIPQMPASPASLPTKKEIEEVVSPEPFTLPNLPQRGMSMPIPSPKQAYRYNAPESLPFMPKIKNDEKEQDLGAFSDMYEEVPFFNQEQELEELSSLKISDSEEEQFSPQETNSRGPLFIRTDNYSNVLTVVDSINDYIELSSDTIYSIENLKKNAAVEHGRYKSLMEDIQRKLIYIDKVLFEKGVM